MSSNSISKPSQPQNARDFSCWSPLLYFVIFMILTSIVINASFNLWHGHFKTKRNPHFRRAWVEHVYKARPKQAGEKLLIIISNSQGYGNEVKDEETYVYLLEKNLNFIWKSPVRVLNWSVHGGAGPEFVILLAAANRLHPDTLLLIVSPGNFRNFYMSLDEHSKPKMPWASDCRFLLGFSDIRKYVPRLFVKHFFKMIDEVDIYLGRYYPLWRYRPHFISWLSRSTILRRFGKDENVNYGKVKKTIDSKLLGYCLETTTSLKAKKVFVLMPQRSMVNKRFPKFIQQYQRQLDATGYEVWDLSHQISDNLSDNHFRTLSHLNKKGHAKLADLLTERLTS